MNSEGMHEFELTENRRERSSTESLTEFLPLLFPEYNKKFNKLTDINIIENNFKIKKDISIIKYEKNNNLKYKLPDNRFSEDLQNIWIESPVISRRIDRFISTEMGRWIRESETHRIPNLPFTDLPLRPALPEPAIPLRSSDTESFRSVSGLRARVTHSLYGLTVNGVQVEADRLVKVDFTPDGRTNFDPSVMTDSLTSGIQGIMELLNAIDSGNFVPETNIFVGTTNINMALIAQRLGFRIVDICRTPEGEIDKNRGTYTVVGNLDDIRNRTTELGAMCLPRLKQRNQRLRLAASIS